MTCPGCGAPLQSDDAERPGYVPPHVLARGEPVVCRRCYRIVHYRMLEAGTPSAQAARTAVTEMVRRMNAVVWIVDATDFAGTAHPSLWTEWRSRVDAGKVWVAVNKVDLLPRRVPVSEVKAWAADQLRAAGFEAYAVAPVSAVNGYGIEALWLDVLQAVRSGARREPVRIGLIGATNTGKSTLLRRLVEIHERLSASPAVDGTSRAAREGASPVPGAERESVAEDGDAEKVQPLPTASPFPGTTQGLIRRVLPGGVELWDSPGLSTEGGRLTDRLDPVRAANLVTGAPLQARLFELAAGQALHWSGWAGLRVEETVKGEPAVFIAYGPGGGAPERTRGERLLQRLQARWPDELWDERPVEVPEGYDVAVAGLGWVSVRRGPVRATLYVPRGVWHAVRINLVGRKPVPARNARSLPRPGPARARHSRRGRG